MFSAGPGVEAWKKAVQTAHFAALADDERRAMRWIRRAGWTLLALGLVAVVAVVLGVRAMLPQTDGRLALPGLQGELRIERDAFGVPTLRAGSLEDLAYGLGVVHVQDRLWQLETHRRIGAGRLAEAFGPPALETDRFLRTLGVRRAAQAQWDRLPEAPRALLRAYARGVNAMLREQQVLPPEFLLLGLGREDWDPVDSLAWSIMMAWDLGGNWTTELLRLRLAMRLPVERIDELLPPYPGEPPPRTADYAALFRGLGLDPALGQQALSAAPLSGVEGVGSNNWVVAGPRSQTGRPLLANDPHLKLSAPALWYFVRLEAPGLKVAGATMPGLPVVVLGQNEHVAWGFTNTGPDVQDLYLERVDPSDPGRYQTPDGWAAFETARETIRVRGAPPVEVTVRRSRHGPVISDAGTGGDVLGTRPGYVLAMRWTALDPDAESASAAWGMMRSRSVAEFVSASRAWVAPMQNMAVADDQGHIALVSPGRVPVRGPEHDLRGLVPAPGWEARYDWQGFVPMDETPRTVDPPQGWLASANQRIVPADYPHHLTHEWALPWRQRRIEQLLAARPQHSLDSFAAMQADEHSLAAGALLPWLRQARSDHPLAAEARRHLQGFDGTMAADRAAPLIHWAWTRHLGRRIFADEVGEAAFDRHLGGRSFQDALERLVAQGDRSGWCDDRRTTATETCGQQAGGAMTDALAELQARFGDDVAQWRWGDAHQARSEHRPFSRVKLLARWFELRAPVGGDTYTVNVSRVGLRPDATTGELYLDEHGPSLRALYDLGDRSRSRFMHSTGQSGLVFSKHYRDLLPRWARVEYLPLWGDGRPPEAVLTVVPATATAAR